MDVVLRGRRAKSNAFNRCVCGGMEMGSPCSVDGADVRNVSDF